MLRFEQQSIELFEQLQDHKKMVLSTALHNHVTSRMMSFIILDGTFYFQTDIMLRKYSQIKQNPQVSICAENIQIEGICKELGHPSVSSHFCTLFARYYPGSYQLYTHLDNERLLTVTPTFVQRWIYENKVPFIETFDFPNQLYSKIAYQK